MEKLPEIHVPSPVGMNGIRVIAVKEQAGSLTITVQKDLDFGLCPCCGTISQKVNDHHTHLITDRPIFKTPTNIEVAKRRWKCVNDFCEAKTFTEEIDGLPKKCTHTSLFYQDVYKLTRRMTYTGAYKHLQDAHCRVALSTVYQRAQDQLHVYVRIPAMVETTYVGIDEFSKGKNHDYGVVLVNLECNKVIDLADGGKTKKAAAELLAKVNINRIKACAIDMWQPFRDACREVLPQAAVVVDRFHVIKETNEALDKVRKRARKHMKSKEKKVSLFKYKELILMGMENLSQKQEERLWQILSWHRDLSRAYELKELLRTIYTGKDAEKAPQEIDNWIREVENNNIPEMTDVAQTVKHWKKEILNFWIHPITNAVTEGKINKIKTLRRRAYNYNNFQSLRLKVLEQE